MHCADCIICRTIRYNESQSTHLNNPDAKACAALSVLAFTLLAIFLLLKQFQVMPDNADNRLFVGRKLQPECLLGFGSVQLRHEAWVAAFVRQITILDRFWKVASDDVFDVVEAVSCQLSFQQSRGKQLTSDRLDHC